MELVVIDVVQEHVHAGQVVGGVVDFLTKEAILNDMVLKLPLCLQQQGARAGSGVVDFVDVVLPVHGQAGNELRHVLRRKEFATRLAGVGGIIVNQKFVGIAEQVNLVVGKAAEVQFAYAFQYGGQSAVFALDGIAQTRAGGVEVGKQTFDVLFGGVAVG